MIISKKMLKNIVLMGWVSVASFTQPGCFFFKGDVEIVADGTYFEKKTSKLTSALLETFSDSHPERIVVIDIVNSDGRVSELGKYITFKVYESLLKETDSSLVPRGVVIDKMKSEGIKISADFSEENVRKLAEILKGDALILGELVDLGVNYELNMKLIDAETGEIISAASEDIERKDTVITLFETF